MLGGDIYITYMDITTTKLRGCLISKKPVELGKRVAYPLNVFATIMSIGLFNRPCVGGAVLQTPSSLAD